MVHDIRIGTQAWSFDDWVGAFYPDGAQPRDYITHYAEQLPIVEVDMTFYRIPARKMVAGWAARTPDEFQFTLKTPRTITHDNVLKDCTDDMDAFVDALQPLGDKLRCVLLQFGYFNKRKFASAHPFFDRLDNFLAQYAPQVPLACEIRNKNWLSDDYFDLLRSHNVAAALVEHAWLPPIPHVVETYDVLTGLLSYVRLVGDRKGIEEITTTWNEIVVDRSGDLERIAKSLKHLATRAELLVFINNHYAGFGPQTCKDLRRLLDD
jgi:uncharacterized protein YecE (DUF72 family)